jgi:hypothetical protein
LPLVVVTTLGFQAAVLAQRPWPTQTSHPVFVSRQTASLPEALRAALMVRDEFSQGKTTLPSTLFVARADLDGNRVEEIIVRSPQLYSGGPQIFVFERQKEQFVEIADLQGAVYFGPRANGYLEIVSQSRGGAGAYTRILYRYERNRYQPVRVADYRETIDGTLEFVRERSPARLRR